MGRIVVHLALMAGGALVVAGCGFADTHASLPEFMRTKAIDPPPPSRRPTSGNWSAKFWIGVCRLVKPAAGAGLAAAARSLWIGLDGVVSRRLTSVMGTPLGSETYRITDQGWRDHGPPARRQLRFGEL